MSVFNMTGGGANGLNFQVVAGTSAPSNPKENTIWVKASSLGAVSFGPAVTPSYSAASNAVYIGYAAASSGSSGKRLNWTKDKGNISGVPGELLSCYQYQSYSWKRVYAYIYKGGSWVQFSSDFSASISVTYPAGSTLTCTDGETTLTATTTTGSYTFDIPNSGTWTVRAVSGSNNASQTVSITYSGQSASVELTYFDGYLFNYGSVNEDITGGWEKDGGGTVTTQAGGSVKIAASTSNDQSIYHTVKKIDLSKFSTLTMNGIMYEYDGPYRTFVCVWSDVTYGKYDSGLVASTKPKAAGASSATDHTVDVSSLTGSYYVGIVAIDHPNYASLTMNTMRLT